MRPAYVLAAGVTVSVAAMLLTHPLAVLGSLLLAVWLAHRTRATARAPWLCKLALATALSFTLLNGLFSWTGETVLWRAPFRLALLGRPILTMEAVAWGAIAGAQLAATILSLGAATIAVPPETLHRAMHVARLPWALATAAGLGLRLVSDTSRDARSMAQALRVRGAHTRGLRGTARVLVPLTARSLDRAFVAEEALVLRGYDRPTAWKRGRLPAVAIAVVAAAVVAAGVAFLGPGRPAYYPTIAIAWDPLPLAWIVAALALPAMLVLRARP